MYFLLNVSLTNNKQAAYEQAKRINKTKALCLLRGNGFAISCDGRDVATLPVNKSFPFSW